MPAAGMLDGTHKKSADWWVDVLLPTREKLQVIFYKKFMRFEEFILNTINTVR